MASDEVLALMPDGGLQHRASGFVCPARLGVFERDAAGVRDGGPYCAYSAMSGLYGTVILKPVADTYDPKAVLAPESHAVELVGGTLLAETEQLAGTVAEPVPVTLRTYQTAKLDSLTYRTQLSCAVFGAYVVEAVVEYAYPRDKDEQTGFINAVYSQAAKDLGGP